MAVWVTAGALLLILLTGASYGYPAKGFNPSSSYGSSYDTSPSSAGREVPSPGGYAPAGYAPVGYAPAGYAPGGYAPAVYDSGAASTNPGLSQPAPRRETSYPQPSARPVAYSSNSFAAPERSGYASSSSVVPSYLQPASSRDIAWAVAPPLPLSGEETSARPSAHRLASSRPAPERLGPSNVSPPGPGYQAGELSKYEDTYEHGNSESETEEQGFQPTPPGVTVLAREDSSEVNPSGPGSSWVEYPYPYDYMFLTGQYPPGTVSHYSSSFEQGRDNWQDTHYVRYYYPAEPSIQQPSQPVKQPSQPVKQPSQPVKQSVGSTSYGQSGAANQPYGGVGLSSSSQPGRLAQPAGGYGRRKGGY